MATEHNPHQQTRLLSPLPKETAEQAFRTFILPRQQSLRRLLLSQLDEVTEASAPAARVTLLIRGLPETFTLKELQVLLLGRADMRSGGFQPDLDLSRYGAHERGVSRAHARLHVQAGKLYVTDLYSANGTFLAGKRLEPEKPAEVKNGQDLLLGALNMRVHLD